MFLCPSQPEYKIADPICTFLFSALVLWTTLPVTKDVFRILMEGKHFSLTLDHCAKFTPHSVLSVISAGTPHDVNVNTVRELLLSVRGVAAVHSLHTWSLNTTHCLLSAHVATGKGKVNTGNLSWERMWCTSRRK